MVIIREWKAFSRKRWKHRNSFPRALFYWMIEIWYDIKSNLDTSLKADEFWMNFKKIKKNFQFSLKFHHFIEDCWRLFYFSPDSSSTYVRGTWNNLMLCITSSERRIFLVSFASSRLRKSLTVASSIEFINCTNERTERTVFDEIPRQQTVFSSHRSDSTHCTAGWLQQRRRRCNRKEVETVSF